MLLGPIVLGLRCDRCFSKHLKCNRVYPACDQCSKILGTPCTFERKVQRKVCGKPLVPKNGFGVAVARLPRMLAFSGLSGAKPVRTFLNMTMTFLSFPSLPSPLKLISIAFDYQKYVRTPRPEPTVESPWVSDEEFLNLPQRAEDAFFVHANVFIGLFSRDLFKSGPRSALLRAAIQSCGLFWCEKNKATTQAQAFLTSRLIQATLPSRLKSSLDTIQSLLVLMIGMFSNSWVTRRIDFFFTTAMRAAYAIGLHKPGKFGSRLELERQLASNCLLYYMNFFITSNNPTRVHLSPLSSSLLHSSDLTVVYSASLSTINAIFSDMVRLKFTLVENTGPISATEIEERITSLEDRLNDLCFGFMVQLHQILANHPSNPQLPALVNIFNFYHSYHAFILSSMRLYRSTTSLHPVPRSPPTDAAIKTSLMLCARAISWALKVGKAQVHLYFVAKLSQLLIFLSHHRKFASPQQIGVLELGLLHLDSLKNATYSGFIEGRNFFREKVLEKMPQD